MSGSTGSGGLTTGDDGPLFCCSNDELPPEVSSLEYIVILSLEKLPFCWTGEKSGGLAGLVGEFGC